MKNLVTALIAALALTAGTTLATAAEIAPPGKQQGQRQQEPGKQGKHRAHGKKAGKHRAHGKHAGKKAGKHGKRHHHKKQMLKKQQQGKGQGRGRN